MTEATTKKPRGRERKTPANAPTTWPVGNFTASIEEGWYILRAGKSLILRTESEDKFVEYCRLIERA